MESKHVGHITGTMNITIMPVSNSFDNFTERSDSTISNILLEREYGTNLILIIKKKKFVYISPSLLSLYRINPHIRN